MKTGFNAETMTWEEMVKKYPDQWVVIENAVMDGADIVSGTVVDVKSDDDIIPFRVNNQKKGYKFYRTTEGDFYGIIDADFSISVD